MKPTATTTSWGQRADGPADLPAPLSAPLPLSSDELERASQTVLRLCSELDGFFSAVAKSGRTALALARDLQIDRNTSQRAMAALASSGEPLHALLRLPGPKGLQQLAEAGGVKAARSPRRRSLLAAIAQYERLVWDLGPSQLKLRARVRATLRPPAAAREPDHGVDRARQAHFLASSTLVGIDMDTHVTIGALRPMPGGGGMLEQFGVTGWIGLRPSGQGLPLSVGAVTLRDKMGTINEGVQVTPIGTRITESDGLIEEFSSRPRPCVTWRSEAGMAVQCVDLPDSSEGRTTDIVLARHRAPIEHPNASGEPVWSQLARIKYPAKRMILDLYLDRQIAIGTPWSASYLWHPALTGHPQRHWHERLPATPRVSVLGAGLAMADTPSWERHRALVSHMYSLVGWNPDEFLGFRCEIDYPIWGATYYLTFDFGTGSRA